MPKVKQEQPELEFDYSKYAFKDEIEYKYIGKPGLSRELIEEISHIKGEPDWMREIRLKAYEHFIKRPMPTWGPDLSEVEAMFDKIVYYASPTDPNRKARSWDEVPETLKRTFERLGIPEAERKYLAGVTAQYDSEVIYHKIREDLERKGVIFTDMDTAVREYPDLVKEYFGTVVPYSDNKFAALNTAVWSGGSFVYVPKGVEVDIPLQTYFRINLENFGQFERTLIIVEEGAKVHYIEGCLPPGELVSLGDTMVNIESISPSDTLITHTGNRRKVLATQVRKHKGEMITIVPQSKGNAFQLTPEHPVLVIREEKVMRLKKRNGKLVKEIDTKKLLKTEPEFVPAGELKVGDFLVFVVPEETEDDPSITDTHLKLLGLYLAEGSVSYNKSLNMEVLSFSFGNTQKEKELAEETLKLIEELGEKGYIVKTGKGYYVVSTYSKKIIEFLTENAGKGAIYKRLSPKIMKLPPEKQKILLDYYIKGDGNIYVKKPYPSKMIRISTASKILAFQIQEILGRLGIYANISIRKGGKDKIGDREVTRKDLYTIQYTENVRFSRVRRKGNIFYVPIVEIKREPYNGFVFNLEVETDNTYLVKGFAVHNCTAPIYSSGSLHSAVVEIIAKPGSHVRYTTIQNWAKHIYNLVTKRAIAYRDAFVEWVNGELGSKVTMKYPGVILKEPGARTEILTVSYAGKGQIQDSGAKAIHLAPYTTSTITSKSVSKDGGRATYRGILKVVKGAKGVKSNVRCDALILDPISRSDTYPYIEIEEDNVHIGHEATVGRIGDDEIFYLMSRGLTEAEAYSLIVLGFIEPFTKTLPMEYAVELNRLIELEMEGSVG